MDNTPDYIELESEQIEVLTGLHQLCPLCFYKLSHRSMPGFHEQHWFCPSCGTEWDVRDLVGALNYDELKEESDGDS